jgi:hypothetical protein
MQRTLTLGRVVLRLVVGSLLAAGLATVGLSLLAFALTTAGMWLEADPEWFWRATGVATIGALDGARASFVLPTAERRQPGRDHGHAPAGTPPEPSARLTDEIAAVADRIESLAPQPQVIAECERLRRVGREVRSA